MHPSVLASLLSGIVLAPWAQEQVPPAEKRPAQSPWNLSNEAETARLKHEILGPWQLISLENDGQGLPKGSAIGFALFLDGYMSYEAHVRSEPTVPDTEGLFFQTGTRRWRFNELMELEMSTLIGTHNLTFDEEVEFEVPGTRRVFTATLVEDELTLDRRGAQGHTRLRFQRLGKLPFPGRDADIGFPRPPAAPPDGGRRPKRP